LRCDKRGQDANRAELPVDDAAALARFGAWDNVMADLAAEYAALESQPGVARGHVGIVGHSEGGLFALALAQKLGAPPQGPAALVLLSTPGQPLADIIQTQLAATMARQDVPPDRQAKLLARSHALQIAIEATGRVPDDVPPGLRAIYPYYIGPYLKTELGLDPKTLLIGLRAPVLVVGGGADPQVPPVGNALVLDQTLAATGTPHRLLVRPEDGHMLTRPGDRHLDPAVSKDASAWLAAHL